MNEKQTILVVNDTKENIHKLIESEYHIYSTLCGMLIVLIAYLIFIPNEVKASILHHGSDQVVSIKGNMLYMGNSSSSPELGDVRVTSRVTDPTQLSIIAEQNGRVLKPFQIDSNNLAIVKTGTHSADEMFQSEEKSNSFTEWFMRASGLIFMLVFAMGIKMKKISINT